jgi:hypothetical protein
MSLASISSNPVIREYAQGAAQAATQPVADFLAPTVSVPTSTGRYKIYTEKNRFHIPDTRRAIGGRATEIRFEAADATYNCEPHALDYPVDNLQQLEAAALENMLMEGATACAEIGALAHEKSVIDKALASLGAGTNVNASEASTVDLVDTIDGEILNVLRNAAYGSVMGVGVLFGASAFRRFKNHGKTKGRYAGGGRKSDGINPSMEDVIGLLIGNPEVRVSYMVHDTTNVGVTKSMQFLLDNAVIVFARNATPTRRDPSFMKTFRLMGQWMVPGSYLRDDQRVEVAKFDWSEDVQITNASAGVRLNFNPS